MNEYLKALVWFFLGAVSMFCITYLVGAGYIPID